MMRGILPFAALAVACAIQSTSAMAQTDISVPGGATGSNVYCLQAGDLKSGAFVGTYLETAPRTWEERLKAGTFKLEERKRDDLIVELFDATRQATIQFDFVNKTIKYKPENSREPAGRDRYYMLNATDKAGSSDCATLAAASAPEGGAGSGGGSGGGNGPGGGKSAGGGGGGNGGGGGGGAGYPPPSNPVLLIVVPPRTPLNIPPGTRLTATGGWACPGRPGFFLCPNHFDCAPIGGVCCPGSGSCNKGSFCDHFIPGNCILPTDARFCPGTGDQATGIAAHCAPGLTCGNNGCQ
jgi:hypothetical protein